jgi:hypothetical protein
LAHEELPSMKKLTFTAVSRNYFNLPIWIVKHRRAA